MRGACHVCVHVRTRGRARASARACACARARARMRVLVRDRVRVRAHVGNCNAIAGNCNVKKENNPKLFRICQLAQSHQKFGCLQEHGKKEKQTIANTEINK